MSSDRENTGPWLEERLAVVHASNRCREAGLQTGNGGNISQRIEGTTLMAVKATDASFWDGDASAATVADFAGQSVEGLPRCSKEGLLHGSIYAELDDVGAIVHCHSPWTVAWARDHEDLPLVTYHSELKLRVPCRVYDTGTYAVPAQWIAPIMDHLKDPSGPRAFILRGHGLVALGRDLKSAVEAAELVEETAQVATLSCLLRTRGGGSL